MAGSEAPQRYLVLCVDRDNDLGIKAKVESPVVGRDPALAAATKLALADPEEADANAIFAAVRKYDELSQARTPCEVAVVCGEVDRGFEADRRIGRQVASVLAKTGCTGVVLVSDGGEDEQVIPIIQSLKPIVSVQRIAVKHSQTVEETYEVLGRYLRMLIFDPHYSKYFLGVPGLVLILAGVLTAAGRGYEAALSTVLIIGGAFLVRGFSVDRTVAGLLQRGPTGYIRFFSMISAVIVVIAGIDTGYVAMSSAYAPQSTTTLVTLISNNPSLILAYGGTLVGYFLGGALNLAWIGFGIYAAGALLSHVARDSVRWRRDGYVIVMLGILYFPLRVFSDFLVYGTEQATFFLISYVLLGLAAIFVLTITIYPRVRTRPAADND
jgi:putative membrane protein